MHSQEPILRLDLARWAADRAYSALHFRIGPRRGEEEWIAAGSVAWERFLATALDEDLALAAEAAREKDGR